MPVPPPPPPPPGGFYPVPGHADAFSTTFAPFAARRSVVHSTKGIVSTTSPLATQAGLRVLEQGGNAADAAVAAAAVLGLVDPAMTGIGGDAFCLFYDARARAVRALNGSGQAARASSLEMVCAALGLGSTEEERRYASIPTGSAMSVTVPGAAAAWVDVVERYGAGIGLRRVLEQAIGMAEEGGCVGEVAAYYWAATEAELRTKPNGIDLLKSDPAAPGGYRAPRPGEAYKNPLLAKTYRLLAEQGRAGFYTGPVAAAVVDAVRSQGGFLDLADLQRHGDVGSEEVEPVALRLREHPLSELYHGMEEEQGGGGGIDLWEHPPNGQGVVAQMALGILQVLEEEGRVGRFAVEEHNSTRYLHALISALRIAFADGSFYITDHFTPSSVPATALLSKSYLTSRAALFDPSRAVPLLPPGSPPAHRTSDTVFLAATDAAGNACSFVNSVAETFGSRLIPHNTGFVLHSRGSGFHLLTKHPNAYAPGKRPYNTIIPAMTTDSDGELHAVLGVMGGAMQPQGHVQVLLNMQTFGMNAQAALDAPRVCVGVSLPGKSTDPGRRVDARVYVEEGVREEVVGGLEGLGHEIVVVKGMGRSLFGRGQVVRVVWDESETDGEGKGKGRRVYSAGSDGRGDGYAGALV